MKIKKKKKIQTVMLQGYLKDLNFGDMLYAHQFYDACKTLFGAENVDFFQWKNYGIDDACRKELGYTKKKSFISCLGNDAFILMSGGSFWDDGRYPLARFKRFLLPAMIYKMMGKPVFLLGIGGGPVETKWLRKAMVWLIDHADLVLFRDAATEAQFCAYGKHADTFVTADTVLAFDTSQIPEFEQKQELVKVCGDKRILLLHIPDGRGPNAELREKVFPGVLHFLRCHPEYAVVCSGDNVHKRSEYELETVRYICSMLAESRIPFFRYGYHDSMQLCALIRECDTVVTEKLHVGVMGAVLGKSVVSFPVHREKTENYYCMTGESERCIRVRDLVPDQVTAQLEKFHKNPVMAPKTLKTAAKENLEAVNMLQL